MNFLPSSILVFVLLFCFSELLEEGGIGLVQDYEEQDISSEGVSTELVIENSQVLTQNMH